MEPVNEFEARDKLFTLDNSARIEGRGPVRWLNATLRKVSWLYRPIKEGRVPINPGALAMPTKEEIEGPTISRCWSDVIVENVLGMELVKEFELKDKEVRDERLPKEEGRLPRMELAPKARETRELRAPNEEGKVPLMLSGDIDMVVT